MTNAVWVLQSDNLSLSGEGINLWIIYILFLTTQGHGGPPGWGSSSMPGPPLRQHKHERRYTPGTHSVMPTRRIWNDDYGGQMIFGDLVSLKFLTFVLQERGKPRETLIQETCHDRGSNSGPQRDGRECYRLFHIGGLTLHHNWINVSVCNIHALLRRYHVVKFRIVNYAFDENFEKINLVLAYIIKSITGYLVRYFSHTL